MEKNQKNQFFIKSNLSCKHIVQGPIHLWEDASKYFIPGGLITTCVNCHKPVLVYTALDPYSNVPGDFIIEKIEDLPDWIQAKFLLLK